MATPRTPKGRMKALAARLAEAYPEALCELDHRNPFELLAATILYLLAPTGSVPPWAG